MKRLKIASIILGIILLFISLTSIPIMAKKDWTSGQKVVDNNKGIDERGPISKSDKAEGIQQIMNAGIMDENFATAIYEAFQNENYYGDNTKTIREILGDYSKTIDASNRGIKNIKGIEWLRNTRNIELGNHYDAPEPKIRNEISDLSPLSIRYIEQISGLTNQDEILKWFKNRGNLEIQLGGNPIKNYYNCVGGLQLRFDGSEVPHIQTDDINAIKRGGDKEWRITKNIKLPELRKNDLEVKFSGKKQNGVRPLTRIEESITTVNKDAEINYQELMNDNLQIHNIKHSGDLWATLGHESKDAIDFYKYNSMGGAAGVRLDPDLISYTYETAFRARVYTPVYTENIAKSHIKVTKSVAESSAADKKVEGAKYYLYDANTNERVADKQYVTNEDGEFIIEENLSSGDYYLMEFQAPDGFELNKDKLYFSILTNEIGVHVYGGDKDLNINAGSIKEDPDTVYIDRYSKDVAVHIKDEPNATLDYIELYYFDRDSQAEEKVEISPSFDSIEDASKWLSDWINTNKGNATQIGIIDGDVRIKAYYTYNKELVTSDSRSVTDVEFKKKSISMNNGKIIKDFLPGAVFELKCIHKHGEQCKGTNNEYMNCMDSHSDHREFLTNEGCEWKYEAESNREGKVLFTNVNSGVYRLTEIKVPNGFIAPLTTWTVTVDASQNVYKIEPDNGTESSKIEGDQNKGYTIFNVKSNTPVVPDEPEPPYESEEPVQGEEQLIVKKQKVTDTNKKVEANVETGDTSNIIVWSIMSVLSMLISIVLIKRRQDKREIN